MHTPDDFSRADLIAICEQAIVPESKWGNRDSAAAHRQLGKCWAQLKAGCFFKVEKIDHRTIWLQVRAQGFAHHDYGGGLDDETYYLPTPERLKEAGNGDWY